jgi:hypothetical protein
MHTSICNVDEALDEKAELYPVFSHKYLQGRDPKKKPHRYAREARLTAQTIKSTRTYV